MEVSIKINGTKEITLNPETPLEHEYLPLIKDSEKYLVTREPNSNKLILKLIKEEKMNRNDKIQSIDSKCQKLADTATRKKCLANMI